MTPAEELRLREAIDSGDQVAELQLREKFDAEDRFVPEPFERNPEIDAGINPIVGALEGLRKGGSLGLDDEIMSVIAAATAAPFVSDKTFSQLMVDARNDFRQRSEQFREQSPGLALASELAGGAVTGIGGILKPATVGGAAAVGALEGAAAGAGAVDADEFASTETAVGAGAGAGLGAALGAGVGSAAKFFKNRSALKRKLIEQVESGDVTDGSLVKLMVNESGKVVDDDLAKQVIKQGFDEPVTQAIKSGSATDKQKMLKSLQIHRRGQADALFGQRNRAGDIAGDSLKERVDFLVKTNRESGTAIDRIARGLKGQNLDVNEAVSNFAGGLDDLGVSLRRTAKGIQPNFDNSILSPGDRGPLREVIRQMARIGSKGAPDAFDAHQLKRAIDNNVTFGRSKTGISGDAERFLKSFRRDLDTALDTQFPDYNDANQAYSDTIQALDMLQDTAGRKLDFKGPNADKALGVALRKLTNNTQGRANMITAIDNAEEVAQKHGGVFDDNIGRQVLFVDELESVVPPPKSVRTTFKSETSKGLEEGINRAASKDRTILGAGAEVASKAVDIIEDISPERAMDAMEQLLLRQ